uniref:Uncharacterized protein n=1 Tax=Arundo donax TaxID=35708 RepID=A0A0A9A7A4_ARUDO
MRWRGVATTPELPSMVVVVLRGDGGRFIAGGARSARGFDAAAAKSTAWTARRWLGRTCSWACTSAFGLARLWSNRRGGRDPQPSACLPHRFPTA